MAITNRNPITQYFKFCLIIYIIILFFLTVARFQPLYWITGDSYYYSVILPRTFNLLPFSSIRLYSIRNINVLGNIALFIPVGIYGRFSARKTRHAILFVLLTTISIESLQFICATGAFDIDDIILNFAGGIIGIGIYLMLYLFLQSNELKTKMVVVTISGAITPYLILSSIKFFLAEELITHLTYIDVIVLLIFVIALSFLLYKRCKLILSLTIILSSLFFIIYFKYIVYLI